MRLECPFCSEEELQTKGCNHKLLSFKVIFRRETIQLICGEGIISEDEMEQILNKQQLSDDLCEKLTRSGYFDNITELDLNLDRVKISKEGAIADQFLFEFLETYDDNYKNLWQVVVNLLNTLDSVSVLKRKINRKIIFNYEFSSDEKNFLTVEKIYYYSNKNEISEKLRDTIFVLFNVPIEFTPFELAKVWYKKGKEEEVDVSAPEDIVFFSEFYDAVLSLLEKDYKLFLKLIDLGKKVFSMNKRPKDALEKAIFTLAERIENEDKIENYILKIQEIDGLINTTRRLFEEVEDKFIFANLHPEQKELKNEKEKLDKAVFSGIIDNVMKYNIFYYWKLTSTYSHYNSSSTEDVIVAYLQRYDILHQSYVFLISKLIPYINSKGLIKK
jgi:hypothetical protein